MIIKNIIKAVTGEYADEINRINGDFENLARAYETIQNANTILAHDLVTKEDELEKIKADHEQYIEMEVERRVLEWSVPGNIRNRAFAEGRMSAYSEMGIWNIEAHERGNYLVRLSNDYDAEIVELITELEDVVAEGTERVLRNDVLPDEIIIDDLVDVGC